MNTLIEILDMEYCLLKPTTFWYKAHEKLFYRKAMQPDPKID